MSLLPLPPDHPASFENLMRIYESQKSKGLFNFAKVGFKIAGLKNSEDMAKKYSRIGAPYKEGAMYDYPVSDLRKTRTVRDAESMNNDRLLSSITKEGRLRKKNSKMWSVNMGMYSEPYSIWDMKDGERFSLEDYYDVDNEARSVFSNRDKDLSTSLGSFKLRSKSKLDFVKYGDKVLPYGNVDHSITDRYDFHEGKSPFGTTGKILEESGLGKPFPVKANWKTFPYGIIKLGGDGKVDTSGVEWEAKED